MNLRKTVPLPGVELTKAGTLQAVYVRFSEVKNIEGAERVPADYGLHSEPGGATGLAAHYEQYAFGDNRDGSLIERKGKPTLLVMQSPEEIEEAKNTGVASLHKNGDFKNRRHGVITGIIAAKGEQGTIDVLKDIETDNARVFGRGKLETVERSGEEVLRDNSTGRPIDGGDPAPGLVQVLKKKPIRLTQGVPAADLKAG